MKLNEINIDEFYPWTYFRLDRFGISKEDLDEILADQTIEVEYV